MSAIGVINEHHLPTTYQPALERSNTTCKAAFGLSATLVALSIITVTGLLLTMGVNYYVYGAAAAGVLGLIGMAITGCKQSTQKGHASRHPEHTKSVEKTAGVTIESEDKKIDGVILREYTITLDHFDKKDFKKWLLNENPPANKQELFKQTLFKALEAFNPKGSVSLNFYQVIQSEESFADILKAPLEEAVKFQTDSRWFVYEREGHTYIDFANAFVFGGGWKGSGTVQEERMFCEFFVLALLAYASVKDGKMIRPATGNPADVGTEPTPFVIPHAKRDFRLDEETYGPTLYKYKTKDIKDMVHPTKESKPVMITGIAARCWHTARPLKPNRYQMHDLVYHLKSAYLAFMGEKLLNPENPITVTGAWGCGAFNNSEMMMTTLQLLAAKMAGVELVLAGTDNKFNPNYTKENVEKLRKWVDLQKSPEKALENLLKIQKEDPEKWAPKI